MGSCRNPCRLVNLIPYVGSGRAGFTTGLVFKYSHQQKTK